MTESNAAHFATDKVLISSVRAMSGGRLTIRKQDGEYRVRLDRRPSTDYFTTDRMDAFYTARAMFSETASNFKGALTGY